MSAAPSLAYTVAMPQPENHLFVVTLCIENWPGDTLDLKMPVWTPGSYLIREYARHVQDFATNLPWHKCSKNHWQLDTKGQSRVTVTYRVFANELTVRTNHLDSSHAYFNGAALFFYVPGYTRQPIRVTIVPPEPDWLITTPLATAGQSTFIAMDYDTLVDSPFEIGRHSLYEFTAGGKPHELAIWGAGNIVPEQVIADIQKIITAESAIFGGLPYDRYTFILHLTANSYGGLEHKDACSLIYPRFRFREKDHYYEFIQLVAHEFFHLWNVKRIRPQPLANFDYDRENYTSSLWFSEGTTSYYDLLIPLRAGIYGPEVFLERLSKDISRLQSIPGRLVESLSAASFDAWIKLYRRDANSDNSQISYYLKGQLVSLLLDLLIRDRTHNQSNLDQVMQVLWQKFGQSEVDFTPEQLQATLSEIAQTDLSQFFADYIHGTAELPFNDYLAPFGLRLIPEASQGIPSMGLTLKTEAGRDIVAFVAIDSPAQKAGINPGDELLAIDGIRILGDVPAEKLNHRLKDYQAGDIIKVSFFSQDLLKTALLTLAPAQSNRYQISAVDQPTASQRKNLAAWLGVETLNT